jgi:hypothetical protein
MWFLNRNNFRLIVSITLPFCFIFQGCYNVKKIDSIPELISIIKPDTVFFPIDDNTPLDLQTLHVTKANENSWLCFVNELNHTFYYREWEGNDSFKTVKLSSTGPDALGPLQNANATLGANGVMVYNPDIFTLFLISKEKGPNNTESEYNKIAIGLDKIAAREGYN